MLSTQIAKDTNVRAYAALETRTAMLFLLPSTAIQKTPVQPFASSSVTIFSYQSLAKPLVNTSFLKTPFELLAYFWILKIQHGWELTALHKSQYHYLTTSP